MLSHSQDVTSSPKACLLATSQLTYLLSFLPSLSFFNILSLVAKASFEFIILMPPPPLYSMGLCHPPCPSIVQTSLCMLHALGGHQALKGSPGCAWEPDLLQGDQEHTKMSRSRSGPLTPNPQNRELSVSPATLGRAQMGCLQNCRDQRSLFLNNHRSLGFCAHCRPLPRPQPLTILMGRKDMSRSLR